MKLLSRGAVLALTTIFVGVSAQDGSTSTNETSSTVELTYPAPLRSHFSQWYPEAGQYLPNILTRDCLEVYSVYLGNISSAYPPGCKNCRIQPVSTCLLENWDESTKSNMASAAVLLGLVPTILALIGSSPQEIGLLALKRPLLAFLLAASTPAVNPLRTSEYSDPAAILQIRPNEISLPRLTRTTATIVSAIEYIFASAAIANLCVVSYQLSLRTICSFAQETVFMPALYAFLALFLHGATTWAISLRYGLQTPQKHSKAGLLRFIRRETLPTICQDPVQIVSRRESYFFVLLTWLASTGTVLHIIFGTLVFSSTLFLTTHDALPVVVQYLVSTLVAGTILRFEIAGMRQTIILPEAGDNGSTSSGTKYEPLSHEGKNVIERTTLSDEQS